MTDWRQHEGYDNSLRRFLNENQWMFILRRDSKGVVPEKFDSVERGKNQKFRGIGRDRGENHRLIK